MALALAVRLGFSIDVLHHANHVVMQRADSLGYDTARDPHMNTQTETWVSLR